MKRIILPVGPVRASVRELTVKVACSEDDASRLVV